MTGGQWDVPLARLIVRGELANQAAMQRDGDCDPRRVRTFAELLCIGIGAKPIRTTGIENAGVGILLERIDQMRRVWGFARVDYHMLAAWQFANGELRAANKESGGFVIPEVACAVQAKDA